MTVRQPASAKRRAVASPIPLAPPVTTATGASCVVGVDWVIGNHPRMAKQAGSELGAMRHTIDRPNDDNQVAATSKHRQSGALAASNGGYTRSEAQKRKLCRR
jgi:hypothetical protein